jgi:hypothetical protein
MKEKEKNFIEGSYKSEIKIIDGNKYLVKTNFNQITEEYDPKYFYYLEALGARFYQHFATDYIMPETFFVDDEEGETNIASTWIDNFIPYKETTPSIKDGKIMLGDKEIEGYISAAITAQFINDQDFIGLTNAGFVAQKDSKTYKNVKIDPGKSFSFLNIDNLKLGFVAHFTRLIADDGRRFHAQIPLDFLKMNEPNKLDERFLLISEVINLYYPEFDSRDLLIGEITYAEISKHPKLYHQMAETITSIIKLTDEDLLHLIHDGMPEDIDGEDLFEIKTIIFNTLKERQKVMHQLYKEEVKYIDSSYIDPPFIENPLLSDDVLETLISESRKNLLNAYNHASELSEEASKLLDLLIKETGLYNDEILLKKLFEVIEDEDFVSVHILLSNNQDQLKPIINNIISLKTEQGIIHTCALMRSKDNESPEIIQLLLKFGADPENQADQFGRIYDISEKLPLLYSAYSALEAESKSSNQELYIPDSLEASNENSLILPLFAAKELIESPNLKYFAKEVLHLPEISLPEFMQNNNFWIASHYALNNIASFAMVTFSNPSNFYAQSFDTLRYGVKLYCIDHRIPLFMPSFDNILLNSVLSNMHLYNNNREFHIPSPAAITFSLATDAVLLYNSIMHNHFRSSNALEGMMSIKKASLIMNGIAITDYMVKTSVAIVEETIVDPLISYFSGETYSDY